MYIERTESSIIGLHKVSRPHWYLNFDKTLTSLQELGPPVVGIAYFTACGSFKNYIQVYSHGLRIKTKGCFPVTRFLHVRART